MLISWKSVADCATLRSQYRIVGKLVGTHPLQTRQNHVMTRPVLLSAEEVTLLVEKGLNNEYRAYWQQLDP